MNNSQYYHHKELERMKEEHRKKQKPFLKKSEKYLACSVIFVATGIFLFGLFCGILIEKGIVKSKHQKIIEEMSVQGVDDNYAFLKKIEDK